MPGITRSLGGDHLYFDMEEEVHRLTNSVPLTNSGRSARTLVKEGPMRVTLVALGVQQRIPPHRAAGPITIQAVQGTIQVEVGDDRLELAPHDLLSLGAGVEHAVGTVEGATFLLTLASVDKKAGQAPEPVS